MKKLFFQVYIYYGDLISRQNWNPRRFSWKKRTKLLETARPSFKQCIIANNTK